MTTTVAAAWQLDFVESLAGIGDTFGLPPSYVKVFAWLLVCEPPEQPADAIRSVLGLSGGAVSMATAALIRTGLVERVTQRGDRRHFYRTRRGGWERLLLLRIAAASEARTVADEALARAPAPPSRLVEMRDAYAWFERAVADLLTASPWAERR